MIKRYRLIANALWLQAGWWACVLGAKAPGWLVMVPIGLAFHLYLCPDFGAEVRALARTVLAGSVLDSVLGAMGVFRFDAWPLPLWLVLLWLVLAMTVAMLMVLQWPQIALWLPHKLGY